MSFFVKHRAFILPLAIACRVFVLGVFILAPLPHLADQRGDDRPIRESRLLAPNDFINNTSALSRGTQRSDGDGPASFLALVCFHRAQSEPSADLVNGLDRHYRQLARGILPIRSPPSRQHL
jgi:hypothetical protein